MAVNNENSSNPIKDLQHLQFYLDNNFPGSVLMPARNGGKIPAYKHKDGQYTSSKFLTNGYNACSCGCLIILSEDLIVIDVDDKSFSEKLEECFPELKETVCCQTQKGFHYYFTRTNKCIEAGLKDGARQLIRDNIVLQIDIKTRTSSGTGGLISIPPSPNKLWLRKLGDSNIYPMPDAFVDFYIRNTTHSSTPSINKKTTISASSSMPVAPIFASDIERLVGMLGKHRANNYDDWMRLGWCLHNIDHSLCSLWESFSTHSYKYSVGECERLWTAMRDTGLHLGSLHMWARIDNPVEYAKYQNDQVFTLIKNCNGSHNAIAHIAHKLYKDRYICATTNGKLWYVFNNTLWEEDADAIELRKELSGDFRKQFLIVINKLTALDSDENQSSVSTSTNAGDKSICKQLLAIAFKLQDVGFKEQLIKEMRDHFYDKTFLSNLDTDPNLIAFTNGVWDLKGGCFRAGKPEDFLSLSVGYDYRLTNSLIHEPHIEQYFHQLHPDTDQRQYIINSLARQLYGDTGSELFHIHAGYRGSAGNGKSKFFEVLELALGDYVHKFAVETLVAKQRTDPTKPVPELKNWRGRRILYCSEPNSDDKLNSGVMKELTGGEMISYRMLFSNDIHKFRPMYKMHIMCNDTPQLDGADQGVKRRIRKIDYISRFVDAEEANNALHMYSKDMGFIERFKHGTEYKQAFLLYLLKQYNHEFEYSMPQVIKDNSSAYLDDNNMVLKFIQAHIVADEKNSGKVSAFTLKNAKDVFKNTEFYNPKINLKNGLERALKVQCISQARVNGVKVYNVFLNFLLKHNMICDSGEDE